MFTIIVTQTNGIASVMEKQNLIEAKGLARGYQHPATARRVVIRDAGWGVVYEWPGVPHPGDPDLAGSEDRARARRLRG